MSSRFDLLTQELFQKDISECSLEQLQNLANEYPYFAPAQFALAKKLGEEMSPAYEAQLQKAVLYFHEPLYFDHFFNQDKFSAPFPGVNGGVKTVEESALQDVEDAVVQTEEINKDVVGISTEIEEYIPPIETPEVPGHATSTEEPNDLREPSPVDVIPEPAINIENGNIAADAPVIPGPAILDAPPSPEQAVINATEKDEALAFEPYHTIDYFASQGIKLSQEEATKDTLGKQLKSFTEWLKTMKRLPVKEQIKQVDPVSEQKVEHLAAHSVEGGDVLTETMAEVWIKQGNRDKAVDTYHKLSLLNPSKRAYFAAKIDSIKREN